MMPTIMHLYSRTVEYENAGLLPIAGSLGVCFLGFALRLKQSQPGMLGPRDAVDIAAGPVTNYVHFSRCSAKLILTRFDASTLLLLEPKRSCILLLVSVL